MNQKSLSCFYWSSSHLSLRRLVYASESRLRKAYYREESLDYHAFLFLFFFVQRFLPIAQSIRFESKIHVLSRKCFVIRLGRLVLVLSPPLLLCFVICLNGRRPSDAVQIISIVQLTQISGNRSGRETSFSTSSPPDRRRQQVLEMFAS